MFLLNEEDLKHVGKIKDLLYMSIFKNEFTAEEDMTCEFLYVPPETLCHWFMKFML